MTGALLLHYDKKFIFHFKTETSAVIELKIWKVSEKSKYPLGIKYSLFCVEKLSGSIIVGIDNHYPKSHHLHIDNAEQPYFFKSIEDLVEDFYLLIRKKGYEI